MQLRVTCFHYCRKATSALDISRHQYYFEDYTWICCELKDTFKYAVLSISEKRVDKPIFC